METEIKCNQFLLKGILIENFITIGLSTVIETDRQTDRMPNGQCFKTAVSWLGLWFKNMLSSRLYLYCLLSQHQRLSRALSIVPYCHQYCNERNAALYLCRGVTEVVNHESLSPTVITILSNFLYGILSEKTISMDCIILFVRPLLLRFNCTD